MGIVRMGLPKDLTLFLKSKFKIKDFIETGTFLAHTSIWAASIFENVDTIENSEHYFNETKQLIKKYPSINFHYGNSKAILPQILISKKNEALFWLDAHWMGMDSYGENDECPIIEEIKIINQSNPNHYILIDDARLFLSPPPLPHKASQWPSLKEIIDALFVFDKYIVVFEDVIIAAPLHAKSQLIEYFQKIATIELNKKTWYKIKDGIIQIKDGIMEMLKK